MQFVADLHLHSKYSRAVSPQMTLPVMAQYAQQKGLDILSAADFTHPVWFKEISNQLEEAEEGMYALKSEIRNSKLETNPKSQNSNKQKETYFILSTEIANIYKQGDKLRRIHNLVFAPNLETVKKINETLMKRGANLNADGRPIIGLSSRNLLELILNIDENCFLIPCHIWTPHFGIYGSASGFDSLEEAFGDLASYIYGIETGLSSDPDMNWSVNELRNRSILSFSDAHSAPKMGREATVFIDKNGMSNDKSQISNFKLTYDDIRLAIMRKSDKFKIAYTIEFYPEEGKYHFSGHRNCKVSYGPDEIKLKGTVCPVCHRKFTEGVLLRVEQLADSSLAGRAVLKKNEQGLLWHTDTFKEQPPYVKLVPLLEIVAEALHSTTSSQKVKDTFSLLCEKLGSEIDILLKININQIENIVGSRVAEGVEKVRNGDIFIVPGYDGEYGRVTIWPENEDISKEVKVVDKSQLSLGF